MAIELVLGPQVSDEQVVVEKEIPSLLNQFSQHFRSVITSCLQKDPKYVCIYTVIGLQKIFLECIQQPTAAQLLNYSLIKKMRKVTALKDHKLLFNRCKRFKRSLTRRKSRNHTPRRLSTAPGQENSAFDHQSLVSSLVVLLFVHIKYLKWIFFSFRVASLLFSQMLKQIMVH